jgi:hypothetical protein
MMLVIKNSIDLSGAWFDYPVGDVNIRLKIRPLLLDVAKIIENRCKEINSLSKDLIDFCLEDFKGVGFTAAKPLEVTLENKLKILSIKGLVDFVLKKASELAEKRIKEVIKFEMEEI